MQETCWRCGSDFRCPEGLVPLFVGPLPFCGPCLPPPCMEYLATALKFRDEAVGEERISHGLVWRG